ncbi:hypothetical protein HQ865_14070 [Mucilaginibacter mali]|uniref:DUF4175 family protein n=1 Tax=Mucilaginibacter mali TaxID=2740462 RepID=A0A7D4Q4C0_9SPHI|nr:DUF4175 family protein [Mucilaginibacter mali]QKJ30827.1 hypothetical protein HQ865_14070 [Mucilaginibacter mali]
MADMKGSDKIYSLRRWWIICQVAADLMLSITITLLVLIGLYFINALHFMFSTPLFMGAIILTITFGAFLFVRKPWQITAFTVSGFLNRSYPGLEESAELVLKPSGELTLLQNLQVNRVEVALAHVPALPKAFFKRLIIAACCLLVACILANFANKAEVVMHVTGDNLLTPLPKKEKVLPQVDNIELTIAPPAYTNKPKREQDKFTILAEEGSVVNWIIRTNIAVKKLSLLFNDREALSLKPNVEGTEWTAQKAIDKPGFYQVNIDDKLSDLYQIEVIKDNAPQIHIKTPKQYTYIDAGEKPQVTLTTNITDDYGISSAQILATVAKGSGEGVKFKEYKIPFGEAFMAHSSSYNLQHMFDLPKLDMEPGDELYFYIEAQDNHQQKSRTDVYTVTIQDTAALLSMDGIVNGSNLKPEYFRSQRQIIMDTEKLLKGRDSLSKEKFNETSNEIGADQKMLRLRYGKFLGEEEESNVGGLSENDELAKAENFSNAKMLLDAYTDKHDNAEDATFFEPGIKAQLKATLTEMWNAELRLRMYKPQDALPFEYKALRLLKDLQQKSRSYVAKTSYKPSPLKMEKRLSGDLDKIIQPSNRQEMKPGTDQFETLKNAVQLLEQIRLSRTIAPAERHNLQLARQQLSVKASAQPGVYLSAVSAMNRILSDKQPVLSDIDMVERAIQRTLPQSARVPQSQTTLPDMGLAQHYYQNLKNKP